MPCSTSRSCNDPVQAFLSMINTNPPEGPTSPSDSPTHDPTQTRNIIEEAPPPVVPMVLLSHSDANAAPVFKSTTEKSSAYSVNYRSTYLSVFGVWRMFNGWYVSRRWTLDSHFEPVEQDTYLTKLNPAEDARHNAALPRQMERRDCTPNTRVKILKEAMDWSRKSDAAKIYWMNGMAGTGKTTIAYTLCKQLEESKQLGASFFCSRASPNCRNVNKIIPTIADQLAQFSNPYQNELCKVLGDNRDVAKREISVQFEKLIANPLIKVRDAIPTDVVIVIDALDECEDTRGTQLVLELLSKHAATIPVKFFVTSRPEPSILKVLSSEDAYRQIFLLHDVEESVVQEDIRTYLRNELESIKVQPDDIERLTVRAGRLFIFAATVVRFIDPSNPAADHSDRLSATLVGHIEAEGEMYSELDKLYSAILSQVLLDKRSSNREGKMRRVVVRTVIGAKEPLTIAALSELVGSDSEEAVHRALLPLQSVLKVSTDRVVSTLHASFPDFILNSDRSKDFYCDISKQNTRVAARCFEVMKRSLKFNICNLPTSSQFDQDVPDLQSWASAAISSGLAYACRYWGDHLYGAERSSELSCMVDEFLRRRLLFWMEVLNLKGWIGDGATILLQALNSLTEDDPNGLREAIQDCRNFVIAYAANSISQSTPHIYVSALPLASTRSFVRQVYLPRMKAPIRIEGTTAKDRGDAALATWSLEEWLSKLGLSRDGKRLVSGAGDGSVIVWDINSGQRLLGPLQKHEQTVYIEGLAFSPDGARIASGSSDSKICVWNSYTGDTQPGSFEGHTASITDLIFSLDGTRLISSSEDHTIRIWDSLTGTQIGSALTGHTACVMSIALTSDGQRLVSGSDDHTIRVWDLKTSDTIIGPLEGHTDWVDCVSLSPDDKYIVSSSRDCTIRVWDIEKEETVVGPLTGHTDRVFCVAFSPDGKRIVSGSFDQTIRVWSSETGDMISGPFHDHEDGVRSVLFSRDGTQIISCSEDYTICIWNADHSVTGAKTEVTGHSASILSIALSPDGTRLVSGSRDHTICVWDTHDGSLVVGPLKGHTNQVWSVAYTPNGACIVSGSYDGTIRTWDAQTGLPLVGPFTGHTDGVYAIAVSPNGRLVVSGSIDCSIKIWDLQNGTEVARPAMEHAAFVRSVDFSPNGSYIASGSWDNSVYLWDAETGALVRKLDKHKNGVMCVRFSPDGSMIVSGSGSYDDKSVVVWDVDTGTALSGPWEGHSLTVRTLAFSSDGSMIALGDMNGTIYVWDAKKRTSLVPPFKGHADWVSAITFTPDNKRIVSSSGDRIIAFWDLDHAQNTQPEEKCNWVVDDNGWVKDLESQLILWLPDDLVCTAPQPFCSLTIPGRSTPFDFSNSIYGDRWKDCYDVSASSDHPNNQ